MSKRLRRLWDDLTRKAAKPQSYPVVCRIVCCGTCQWYHGISELAYSDGKHEPVAFFLFGYCGISMDAELTRIDDIKIKEGGNLLTFAGPPTVNRHFFQVCGAYLRKKGN